MKSFNILKLFVLCTLISCGQANTKQVAKAVSKKNIPNWKTFDAKKYSIQYPPAWELDKSGQMGAAFFLLAPLESENDAFRENFSLLIQDLSGRNIDLDKYSSISESQIKTMGIHSSIIESKRIKNVPEEYQRIIYISDQGVYHLKFEQYYFVKDNNAYVLTFTAEQSKFDDYKEKGENILNTFALND